MSTASPAPYSDLDKQYINGEWRSGASGKKGKNINPFSGETILEIPYAGTAEVDVAMEAARLAQPKWGNTPAGERSVVLLRVAEIMARRKPEIVAWLGRESGSSVIKANIEWNSARNVVLEAATYPTRMHGRLLPAGAPDKESRIYRLPIGVILVISPWNFPLHLSMRSIAGAVALGNTVVHKPAGDTPITGGLLIAKIFEEAGLPAGVFNVLVGPSGDIGDYLVQHQTPRFVSFTGSTEVGKRLGALATGGSMLKRLALELGGNSPCAVLADADLDTAVGGAIFGKFLHQGQICMAINRIIVEAPLYDRFVDQFTDRARALPCGDPLDKATVIGSVINRQQTDKLAKTVEKARADGARETLAGSFADLLVSPFVFADVDPRSDLAMQETFGPVACIIKAADAEEALRIANMTPYGLSSCVFSGSPERGVRFARRIEAGMTHINDSPVADLANAPFGGEKNSGLGRFNGDWLLEEMTTLHWLTVQDRPAPYPF